MILQITKDFCKRIKIDIIIFFPLYISSNLQIQKEVGTSPFNEDLNKQILTNSEKYLSQSLIIKAIMSNCRSETRLFTKMHSRKA